MGGASCSPDDWKLISLCPVRIAAAAVRSCEPLVTFQVHDLSGTYETSAGLSKESHFCTAPHIEKPDMRLLSASATPTAN